MATFAYKALENGKTSEGVLNAENRQDALRQLHHRGLRPVSLKESAASQKATAETAKAAAPRFSFGIKKGISFREREDFARQLSSLLAAGVPLSRAMQILNREASSPAAKQQWQDIHDRVVDGASLADAMAQYPDSFPRVQVAMVRAGEAGGFLDKVLGQIADFLRNEKELRGKVLSAMVYPIILMVMVVAVLIFLMVFFIPRFQKIFDSLGGHLPLITQIIVGVSHAVRDYGLYLIVVVGFIIYQVRRWSQTKDGRRLIQQWVLRTPILGSINARFSMTRFCQMLGTLIGAGVPLVQGLRVARESIVNQTLIDALSASIEKVRQGASLANSLRDSSALFPESVIEMIAVAEESGRLEPELLRLAKITEEELDRKIRMAVSLAEPVLLLLMAALIGVIFIGMVLPIFNMQNYIK
ncbi:TPA: hypothetical protein DDW35_06140 [Candidatus Sumerlaeota bacterium]|jgi:type II secretory pathway component PulF|nr:hypothetical protein [Candidatus Sumerlaeota bacterium]